MNAMKTMTKQSLYDFISGATHLPAPGRIFSDAHLQLFGPAFTSYFRISDHASPTLCVEQETTRREREREAKAT